MSFDFTKLSQIQDSLNTPVYSDFSTYEIVDEEIRPIAEFIKSNTIHNENIEPDRIKFAYTMKPKKDGGRYVVGYLHQRSDIDKIVDSNIDFVVILFYPIWKDLDGKNKLIQLDKILSGIDTGTLEKPVLKKQSADSKEYRANMKTFGAEEVMNSSDIVHDACESYVENLKESLKNGKK